MQRGSGRAKQALSHVLKHEERFGSLCSGSPPPRAQGLQACIVLAARTLGKCDFCAPRLGREPGQAPCQRRGGGSRHAGLDTPTWRQRPLAFRGRMRGRWQRPPSVGHQWWAAPGLTRGGRRLLQPALPLRGRFGLRPHEDPSSGAGGTVVAQDVELPTTATHAGSGGQGPTQAAEQGDTEDVVAFDLVIPRVWSPSHQSVSNSWIPTKISSNPSMSRQVCDVRTQFPVLPTHEIKQK